MVNVVGIPKDKTKTVQQDLDVSEQLDELKKSLLAEFQELLAMALQGLPISDKLSAVSEKLEQINDPTFIPEKISGDIEQDIEVEEDEADAGDIDDIAEALRRAKQKEKDNG